MSRQTVKHPKAPPSIPPISDPTRIMGNYLQLANLYGCLCTYLAKWLQVFLFKGLLKLSSRICETNKRSDTMP